MHNLWFCAPRYAARTELQTSKERLTTIAARLWTLLELFLQTHSTPVNKRFQGVDRLVTGQTTFSDDKQTTEGNCCIFCIQLPKCQCCRSPRESGCQCCTAHRSYGAVYRSQLFRFAAGYPSTCRLTSPSSCMRDWSMKSRASTPLLRVGLVQSR